MLVVLTGSLAPAAPAADRIALVRKYENRKARALFLLSHDVDGPADAFVSDLLESIKRVKKAGGKRPVRHLFPADWNGDGADELVLLRRDAAGLDRLDIIEAPQTVDGDSGNPVASYADVSAETGFENVSVSRIQVDGHEPTVPPEVELLEGLWHFTIVLDPVTPSGPHSVLGPYNLPDGSGAATYALGLTTLQDWSGVLALVTTCGGACGTVTALDGSWTRTIGTASFNQLSD